MTGGKGVVVNAALTSSGIGNLIRLNATTGDVNINAAVTASASGASVQLNAGHDVNINAATGSIAGGVVTASGGGAIAFVSDTLGVPGPTGGAVNICAGCAVTSTNVTVYYSPPNGYGSPTPYTGFTAHEWVFVQADNKIYDATTAATARFYGDPTVGGTVVVGLTGGAISFVDKNVGVAKPVTFSGYSINGSGAAAYALFAGAGSTNAAITPAPLSVTANSTSKVYGQTTSLATTAFTSAGLKGSDTIAGVTETSPGASPTATLAGSPYTITASNAVGGSYVPTNYTTTYASGVLVTLPGVTPPVVTSPVVGVTPLDPTTPGVTPPVAVTPVAVTPFGTTPGTTTTPGATSAETTPFGTTLGATTTPGARSAESTPVVTPQVETLPTFATLEGTRPLVTSTVSSVGAPTGFPLVVVGQGVNKPVFAAAAASPATVFPAPAMPVIGEYPRKPDRN